MKSDFLTRWINSRVLCVWETIFKAFKKVGSHHNKFFILLSCNKLKPVYHVLGTFTHSLIIPLPYLNKASIKASIVASPVFLVYFVVSWMMRTTIMKSIVYILRLETNWNQWRRRWMHKGQRIPKDFHESQLPRNLWDTKRSLVPMSLFKHTSLWDAFNPNH